VAHRGDVHERRDDSVGRAEAITKRERGTLVFVLHEGSWRIVHEHFSAWSEKISFEAIIRVIRAIRGQTSS
jgi:hypothetical protein